MIRDIESYFHDYVTGLSAFLMGREIFTIEFEAEQSDFVRLNRAKLRQAGSVAQSHVTLRLALDQRHAATKLALSGDLSEDLSRARVEFDQLRSEFNALPEDPYFSVNANATNTRTVVRATADVAADVVNAVLHAAAQDDLAGIVCSGPLQRGFASSFGQRNWHEVSSCTFDWSHFGPHGTSVKSRYASARLDRQELTSRLMSARERLRLLQRDQTRLAPGNYRAFLAPAALAELVSILGWDGFSAKARCVLQSPLQLLAGGQRQLSPLLTISENIRDGLAPPFQAEGFMRPDCLPLVKEGRDANALVSPRTSKEYGLQQNGAETGRETPVALDVDAGNLETGQILSALGTGLWIDHLWYLNYSDRMNCRVTGMTRFATMWVEQGRIVGPAPVMRFDDSLYRLLGDQLEALTRDREFFPDPHNESQRSTASLRAPGALVGELRLTV